ncbi:MAG: carboxylating nicotinate-nucleotide diphosphorylase [bacterium]|nr:carboxylating nicotinate-nucleotide diphosphorylase [bacterium]
MKLKRYHLEQIVRLALKEDIGKGDITTELVIPEAATGNALIISKEPGVLAGGSVANAVFKTISPESKFVQRVKDGETFKKGATLFEIHGPIHAILKCERTALNFLQRLSGIATLTYKFVNKVKGTKVKILDTRKTTPGLRELEKYAVRCGGGYNHRFGLWDMILIKDNHIRAAGGIKEAISKIKNQISKIKVEIEVKNLSEFKEAITYPVDMIMLDNMPIKEMREAVKLAKKRKSKIELEASGGINLNNVREIAKTGVDYISVGKITRSAPSIDMSLEIVK